MGVEIFAWLHQFIAWIRDTLGTVEKRPECLEEFVDKDTLCKACLMFDEERSPLPGVVAIWKISCPDENVHDDLLLILVNIAKTRQKELYSQHEDHPLRRRLEVRIKTALIEQGRRISGSHLWITAWVGKKALTKRAIAPGQTISYLPVSGQFCALVDLQGTTIVTPLGHDGAALRILRAIALHLTSVRFNRHGQSWQDAVDKIDWLKWLHYMTTTPKKYRIASDHILQPPLSKLRRKRDDP